MSAALHPVANLLQLDTRAEVHQHDPPALVAHHVVRLDVAVHQAGAVHRRERARVESRPTSARSRAPKVPCWCTTSTCARESAPSTGRPRRPPMIRAVNRDDVLMAYRASSRASWIAVALALDLSRVSTFSAFRRQVQRPPPVDHAEAADAEHAADLERPPMLRVPPSAVNKLVSAIAPWQSWSRSTVCNSRGSLGDDGPGEPVRCTRCSPFRAPSAARAAIARASFIGVDSATFQSTGSPSETAPTTDIEDLPSVGHLSWPPARRNMARCTAWRAASPVGLPRALADSS